MQVSGRRNSSDGRATQIASAAGQDRGAGSADQIRTPAPRICLFPLRQGDTGLMTAAAVSASFPSQPRRPTGIEQMWGLSAKQTEMTMATVFGTDNPETLDANDGVTNGADTIFGFGGDDIIFGLGGNDVIKAGGGADTINGGAGIDTANYSDSTVGVTVDLAAGTGTGGTAQGDTFVSIENLVGSGANDNLFGNEGANDLRGGNGDDHIEGGASNDSLYGEAGADDIRGGTNDDFIDGGADNDTLFGDAGNDALWGRGGDDTLDGGTGNDLLVGGSGVDVMHGGAGDDALYANIGPDGGFTSATPYADTLFGDAGDDVLVGSFGNNYLNGGADDDLLSGGFDSDVLDGGTGNDTLRGGSEADTLYGGAGTDVLDGGTGDDLLDGGAGADTFMFAANWGNDVIVDFQDGAGVGDVIAIDSDAFTNFAEVQAAMTQVGADVRITLDSTDTILIQNTTIAQFGADDFTFL